MSVEVFVPPKLISLDAWAFIVIDPSPATSARVAVAALPVQEPAVEAEPADPADVAYVAVAALPEQAAAVVAVVAVAALPEQDEAVVAVVAFPFRFPFMLTA